jgi:hypothetical protein
MRRAIETAPEVTAMRKHILISIALLAFAAATVASVASASFSTAPLIVAMKDPGCHWFYVGGGPNHRQYVKSLTRSGPVTLLNLDEAALVVKGPSGTKIEKVGAKLTLKAKGVYHITMVRQAPDDNHLTLTVR